jgi:DNA replication protein
MCAVEGRFNHAGVPDRLKGLSLDTLREVAPSATETQAAQAVKRLQESGEVKDPRYGTWRESLCMVGPNGTGKSGLLVHLARQHFLAGQIPLWIKYQDLVRDGVQAGYGTSVEYAPGLELSTVRLQAAQRVDVLLIDDLGDPFAPSDQYAETSDRRDILFRILSARHEEGLPTHITSNHRTLEELKEQFDPRTADRIKELCATVKMDGPNLRELK